MSKEPNTKSIGKAKLKFSVFKLTLNSNKTYHTMSEEDKKKFKQVAQYMFSDHVKKYLIFQEGDLSKIKETNYHYRFELSEVSDWLHLHGIIKMTHKAKLRLNYVKLKEVFNEILGGCYLNIVASTDQEAAWLAYINKGKKTGKIIEL